MWISDVTMHIWIIYKYILNSMKKLNCGIVKVKSRLKKRDSSTKSMKRMTREANVFGRPH